MNEIQTWDKNWLEWFVFAVGALLTAGTVVFFSVQAWSTPEETQPQLGVALGTPYKDTTRSRTTQDKTGGLIVPVTVTNQGGAAAENIEIVVVRMQGEKKVGSATLTLSFAPRNAERKGQVLFPERRAGKESFAVESVSYYRP